MIAKQCRTCGHVRTEEELALKRQQMSERVSAAAKATWRDRYASGEAYRAAVRLSWRRMYELRDAGKSVKEIATELNTSVSRVDYALSVRRRDQMREQLTHKGIGT